MTTNIGDTTKLDDLYAAIVARIEANDLEGALALYNTVERTNIKLELLSKCNRDVMNSLSRDFFLARHLVLARDLAFTRDVALARHLALVLAIDLTHALDRARALEHADALDRILTFAFNRAHALDRENKSVLKEIAYTKRINRFILSALGGEITSQLVFEDIDVLTPEVLRDDLAPYLRALFDLEKLLVEAKGVEFQQPKIKSISQSSPITVELTGIPEAIKVLRSLISPFWRQYEQQKAQLELIERKVALARSMLGENPTPEQIERGIQIIDALNRKPPTLPEM